MLIDIKKITSMNSVDLTQGSSDVFTTRELKSRKINITNNTPLSSVKREVSVKINNESQINDFVINQKTLALEIFDGELVILNKTINSAERTIIATDKDRGFSTRLDIVSMKLNKFAYDLSMDFAFYLKKQLVLHYDFYLKMTTFSNVIKSMNVFLLNLCLKFSRVAKKYSLDKQKTLVDNKYYYKEKVFSEDELYTVAKEIASEISKQHLKLTIANIQKLFSIESYRQARKIYLFIKENKLVG